MTVELRPEPGAPESGRPAATPTRSRLRLATIGGIAAIAILGGGITAAASAGAPAAGAAVAAATGTAATPSSGPRAAVTLQPSPTGTATPTGDAAPAAPPAPKVHQPHLDGTVTSVSGSTVLIKDHEGFTRTVVESSGTTYQDGLKAALTVGTKIHAEGTVASNGTSLDATVISADRGPAGGPGGSGPRGPGGPGGKHAGPPNGAPTPPVPGGTAAPTPPAGTAAPMPPAGTVAPTTSAPATTK